MAILQRELKGRTHSLLLAISIYAASIQLSLILIDSNSHYMYEKCIYTYLSMPR